MFQSKRRFQLWDYFVSHKQLLIRSPASPEIPSNIDVVFWGVEFVSAPTTFDGLEIICRTRVEEHSVPTFVTAELFVIKTGEASFVVAAAGFKVLENTLDTFESSLERFAATDQTRDLGTLLADSKADE